MLRRDLTTARLYGDGSTSGSIFWPKRRVLSVTMSSLLCLGTGRSCEVLSLLSPFWSFESDFRLNQAIAPSSLTESIAYFIYEENSWFVVMMEGWPCDPQLYLNFSDDDVLGFFGWTSRGLHFLLAVTPTHNLSEATGLSITCGEQLHNGRKQKRVHKSIPFSSLLSMFVISTIFKAFPSSSLIKFRSI